MQHSPFYSYIFLRPNILLGTSFSNILSSSLIITNPRKHHTKSQFTAGDGEKNPEMSEREFPQSSFLYISSWV
jgi:hypothetical protein